MESLFQDLRYTAQQLWKNKGFAIITILSLSLGIGATTAVFSVIYSVLLDPYPYPNADRMVHLLIQDSNGALIWPLYLGSQLTQVRQAQSVESAVGYCNENLEITGGGLPEAIVSAALTSNAFSYFGVRTLLGRGLLPADAQNANALPVTVLGYKFWRRYYASDSAVLGRTLQLNHKNYVIVGVAPLRFTWGDGDVYLPAPVTDEPNAKFEINLLLRKSVSRASAQAELASLLRQFASQNPKQFPEKFVTHLTPLNEIFENQIGPTLYLLLGAVGLLLAIGCCNVSILLMVRGDSRSRELAVRSAIGASRPRLLRLLLTEALFLSLVGSGAGVLLAYRLLGLIREWLPSYSFPHEAAIRITIPVLLFTTGLAFLTGLLFGLMPAIQFSRPNIAPLLQRSSQRIAGTMYRRYVHGAFIVGQVGLTLLLLSAAGLAMQSFARLMHRPLGYEPHHVMAIGIPIEENTYLNWDSRRQYFSDILKAIGSTPDVSETAISWHATPPSSGRSTPFIIFGHPEPETRPVSVEFVSSGYFHLLQVPLLAGRIWDESEVARGAPLGIVNQNMGRLFFPGKDPIGQHIRIPHLGYLQYTLPAASSDQWIEIVGVAGDALDDGLDRPIAPAIYTPYSLLLERETEILVRTNKEPLAVLPAIRQQILSLNADQQIEPQTTDLEQWIQMQPEWARGRLVAVLFAGFSFLALLLAAVGLYSVVAYLVTQRRNEFGIRMALGAQPLDVLKLVFGSVSAMVGSGIAFGLLLDFALQREFQSLVGRQGTGTWITSSAVLVLVMAAALACIVPARRAASVEPMEVLRSD
jgi:predicted permease